MNLTRIDIETKVQTMPFTSKVKKNHHKKYRKSFAKKSDYKNKTKTIFRRNWNRTRTSIEQDTYMDKDTEIMKIYADDKLVLNTSKNLRDSANIFILYFYLFAFQKTFIMYNTYVLFLLLSSNCSI